jgi:secondary thiamine-phosphate synthase enzyme
MLIEIILDKEFTDITNYLNDYISGSKCGFLIISSLHTTCGLKILEHELLSLSDIDDFLKRIVPENKTYAHDKINLRQVPVTERINGASHVRMLFFESSLVIPVIDGKLALGEWQRVMAVEMDGAPPRERKFLIQMVIGNEN